MSADQDDEPTPPRRARSHWGDRERAEVGRQRREDGAPVQPWHEEATGVHTDTQVFRALKGLRDDIEANKVEAARAHGALKAEVVSLAATVGKQGEKLDDVTTTAARMEGKLDVMLADRRPASSSSQGRVVETLLTDRLNEQQHQRERRMTILKAIASVFTSPAVIAAAATGLTLLAAKGC